MNAGSAILHFCLCCPGQAQTGDHAASTEDTDGKKPGGELEKAGSGWAGFAEFGACAGQGLPFAGVGSAILHFCQCCPGQAQAGDRAASTEDTDLKKPGGEARKLEKAGWGWVGSPTSAPGQGRAFLSAVWAVHSYTFPCAAPARHRLGTMRQGHGPEEARWRGTKAWKGRLGVGGFTDFCTGPSFCLSGQSIPTLSPVLPPGHAQAGDRAASTEDTDPKKLEKAGSLRSFGSSGLLPGLLVCTVCNVSTIYDRALLVCSVLDKAKTEQTLASDQPKQAWQDPDKAGSGWVGSLECYGGIWWCRVGPCFSEWAYEGQRLEEARRRARKGRIAEGGSGCHRLCSELSLALCMCTPPSYTSLSFFSFQALPFPVRAGHDSGDLGMRSAQASRTGA